MKPERWPITWDLAGLRARVETYAARVGLAGTRLSDLVLAVNEAVINVLEHAGTAGRVGIRHDDTCLIVEIIDYRGGFVPSQDHLIAPAADANRGFGLWIMSQLCDAFAIHAQPHRTCVQLQMTLPATHP